MIKINEITPVIVSYYRAERLAQCIETLKKSNNIIVWENSGGQTSKHYKKEYNAIKKVDKLTSNTKFFYTPENVGVAEAFNKGIINAKTDWVLLTVDDMLFDENWFDMLTSILEEKPHLEQVHLNAWNAMAFHKKTIARMGWWDERYRRYPSMEDDDWYLRTIEHLGYSPYTSCNPGFNFHPEYIQNDLWPLLDDVEELHDRPDNFTYFFNSPYSKYPIIGKDTITGGDKDAGSRNNFNETKANLVEGEKPPQTGVEFHMEKWEFGYFPGVSKDPNFLLAKDGRFWKRKSEDIDFYPKITKQYKEKYEKSM